MNGITSTSALTVASQSAGLDPVANIDKNVMIQGIFGRLGLQDLMSCSRVCKSWRALEPSDLTVQQALKADGKVIGKEQWEQHVGKVGDVLPLPKDCVRFVKTLPRGVFAKSKLLLIPQNIDGKPLTINSLGKLMGKKINGTEQAYGYDGDYIWDLIVAEISDKSMEKAHYVWITTDLIPESRSKTFDEQVEQIKKLSSECEAPSTLEAIALLVMNFVCSGDKQERLLGKAITRCKEKMREGQMVVGDFVPSGPTVDFRVRLPEYFGVLAVRKFC